MSNDWITKHIEKDELLPPIDDTIVTTTSSTINYIIPFTDVITKHTTSNKLYKTTTDDVIFHTSSNTLYQSTTDDVIFHNIYNYPTNRPNVPYKLPKDFVVRHYINIYFMETYLIYKIYINVIRDNIKCFVFI